MNVFMYLKCFNSKSKLVYCIDICVFKVILYSKIINWILISQYKFFCLSICKTIFAIKYFTFYITSGK